MADRPVKVVDTDGDIQTIAIYVMRKLLAGGGGGGGSGDVVGPASSADGDFAQFDGTTGKLLKDGGFGPGDFVAESVNRRYVANVETQVVGTRTSRYITHDFEVESGGTLEIESDGAMEIG